MSRPHKTKEEQLSRQIIYRVSVNDALHLDALALKAGLRTNELARRLATDRDRQLVFMPSKRLDPFLVEQIARVGANLNQAVKLSHMRGEVSPRLEGLALEFRAIVLSQLDEEPQE
jgi:hypothetical protein